MNKQSTNNPHITLLGDSIFDNESYTNGQPDVITRLREQMPPNWKGTLCAVDGDITSDVKNQLSRIPSDATHLFVSVGGNDALGQSSILLQKCQTIGESLILVKSVADQFHKNYADMLSAVLKKKLPTAVCTIYNPNYSDTIQQAACVSALAHFNDAILRCAFAHGVPVIDLRSVCDSPSDYANPIEPSSTGAIKIAARILEIVNTHNWNGRSEVFG